MADLVNREFIPADEDATTGHQSHRFLRLSLAMIVVALLIGVLVQFANSGGKFLPSISHYFYTPAHNVFVAALVAASLALVVLAGRDLETVFLDIAAVFAPLIAIVPTGITAELLTKITDRDVVTRVCDGDNCLPEGYLPAIQNGVATYSFVLFVVVILTVLLRRKTLVLAFREKAGRRWRLFSALTAPIIALLVAAGLLVATFAPWANKDFPFPSWMPLSVHFAVTIVFFGTFTIVPVINAVRFIRIQCGWVTKEEGESEIKTWQGILYVVVPVLMIADIDVLVRVVGADWEGWWVLAGEALALILFALFWVVQTFQRWEEKNQRGLRATNS